MVGKPKVILPNMHNHTFSTNQRCGLRSLVAGAIIAFATAASAAVYNWNGGSEDWDTTSANWNGSGTIWPASGTDNDAVFAGTPGTVLITGGGGTVNDITFNTTGYSVTGGTLTLNGSTPTIHTAVGVLANISAPISGATMLTKSGTGTLALSGSGSSLISIAATEGTVHVSGGSINLPTGITVGSGAPLTGTFRITSGTVQASAVGVAGGSSAIRLEGGTLKADSINLGGTGTFIWGAGTLAHFTPNGSTVSPDYTIPLVPIGSTPVYAGTELNFTGNLISGEGSVLDLGASHLSGGVRFNRLLVSGNLDLTAANDVLRLDFNPYFLRPQSWYPHQDWGSIPLVVADGTLSGEFDDYIINTAFGNVIPFTFAGVVVGMDAADLATDTWALEYDSGENTIWLHYKVSPTIPEPATAGLLFLSVASARIASKFRRRKAGKESDAGRFDDETKSHDSWFDPAAKL